MSRMNEQSSKKASQGQSKFLKDRTAVKKGKNAPTGKITKNTGNKKNS